LFTVLELPAAEGQSELEPEGLNSAGDVVGTYSVDPSPSPTHAFLYEAATGATRRIADDGSWGQAAHGINDAGQVAMTIVTRTGGRNAWHAVRWENGDEIDIGSLPPGPNGPYASSVAINAWGWIAGWSLGSTNWQRAVLWDESTLTDLGSASDTWSTAKAINAWGVVVGATNIPGSSDTRPAVFENGAVRDLGTLGGGGSSSAAGISDQGRVVGGSPALVSGRSELHAFAYDLPVGPMVDISPDGSCTATGVNNPGEVVGSCSVVNPNGSRAAFWKDGVLYDLNDVSGDPSWVLWRANAINDSGQIIGFGMHDGVPRGFLLTPR
jgi:uncharacterized membrane protein